MDTDVRPEVKTVGCDGVRAHTSETIKQWMNAFMSRLPIRHQTCSHPVLPASAALLKRLHCFISNKKSNVNL